MKRIVAVAGLMAFIAAAPLYAQEEVAEPKTGVKYAVKDGDMNLMGVGLRIKKILFIKAKVYTIGFYVSDAALEGPLAAHKGKVGTPAFSKDLATADFDKQLVLKFVRNVGAKKIQNAMREALEGNTDEKLLDQFISYFPEVKEGQECILRWKTGGILETTMVGQVKPPIESQDFVTALFDLYVGNEPLQPEFQKGLTARAATLLP